MISGQELQATLPTCEKKLEPGVGVHGKQRQVYLLEFKASLVYRVSSRTRSIGRKETTKNKKLVNMYLKKEAKFQPQQAAELGSFSQVVLSLESRIEERGYGICLCD